MYLASAYRDLLVGCLLSQQAITRSDSVDCGGVELEGESVGVNQQTKTGKTGWVEGDWVGRRRWRAAT